MALLRTILMCCITGLIFVDAYSEEKWQIIPVAKSARRPAKTPAAPQETCTSKPCKAMVEKVVSSMDASVDPCDDFFSYACGGWIDSHDIPDNESTISHFWYLKEAMKKTKQRILETMKGKMFASEVKAKSIYRQCKDKKKIDRLRSEPFMNEIRDLMGGWPLLQPDWNPDTFDLFGVLTNARVYGIQPLLSVTVQARAEDPTKNSITIEEPSLETSKDVLLSDAGPLFTESYHAYLNNITSLLLADLGDERDVADPDLAASVTDILQLERHFAMIQMNNVERRDMIRYKNKMSLKELQHRYKPKSALLSDLKVLIQNTFAPVDLDRRIKDSTEVVLAAPDYFKKLDKKLHELERKGSEGKRRLANYIGWQIFMAHKLRLSQGYRDAWEVYEMLIYGRKTKREKSRGEICGADVTDAMPLTLDAMYVRDVLPKDLKAKLSGDRNSWWNSSGSSFTVVGKDLSWPLDRNASMMTEDILEGVRQLIHGATWMDVDTTNAAMKKLNNMLELVAYPDLLVNNLTAIDKEYKDISVQSTYFETLLEIDKWGNFKNLRKLTKRNERDDPLDDALDITQINAYNQPYQNKIILLAGILQLPMFEADSPQWANYGGIGFVLGHELTHGFDDQGAEFDQEGRMVPWWTNDTLRAFNERKQSMITQYDKYSFPDIGHVNGHLTLGENIADNGGVKAAYRGYKLFHQRQTKPEPVLPGLEQFTPEQLFFLSAGQVWCKIDRKESLRLDLLTDVHSPGKFRIIGPMSNMPEFAEAFKCRSGTKMNPATRSVVW